MAEQVQGVFDPAGAEQWRGVQGSAQLPCTEAPGLFRQRHGPIEQGLVQVVGHEPHPEVEQRALAEGGLLSPETVQHPLPALVHHGELYRVSIADMTIGLQQRREGQQARLHRRLACPGSG